MEVKVAIFTSPHSPNRWDTSHIYSHIYAQVPNWGLVSQHSTSHLFLFHLSSHLVQSSLVHSTSHLFLTYHLLSPPPITKVYSFPIHPIQVYSFHPRLFFTVDFLLWERESLQFTVYSGVHLKSTVHCRLSLTVNPFQSLQWRCIYSPLSTVNFLTVNPEVYSPLL